LTSIRGGSDVVNSGGAGVAGVYLSHQQQMHDTAASNVAAARQNRSTDSGSSRPSPYGPRGPSPKTGWYSVVL